MAPLAQIHHKDNKFWRRLRCVSPEPPRRQGLVILLVARPPGIGGSDDGGDEIKHITDSVDNSEIQLHYGSPSIKQAPGPEIDSSTKSIVSDTRVALAFLDAAVQYLPEL
jgi:hypothetical protein